MNATATNGTYSASTNTVTLRNASGRTVWTGSYEAFQADGDIEMAPGVADRVHAAYDKAHPEA